MSTAETPTRTQIGELVDEYRDAVERFFDDNALESLNALNAARANLDCALDAALTAEHEARARDAETLLEENRELRTYGGMLANCAFNLAQDLGLTDRQRHSLDESRRNWDAALERMFAARAATRGETPQ